MKKWHTPKPLTADDFSKVPHAIGGPYREWLARFVYDYMRRLGMNVDHIIPYGPIRMPTDEGRRRMPPDGWYIDDIDKNNPCICKISCPRPCKGDCGCQAHYWSYQDFLSSE